LSRLGPLLAVLARWGEALEQAAAEGRLPADWEPVCPFCGGGPVRWVPAQVVIVRVNDSS
jgi:hypothetical protein